MPAIGCSATRTSIGPKMSLDDAVRVDERLVGHLDHGGRAGVVPRASLSTDSTLPPTARSCLVAV